MTRWRLWLIGYLSALTCAIDPAPASTVWLNPAPDSPDFMAMFTHPEAWLQARSETNVIQFGPQQLDPKGKVGSRNFLPDLVNAGAFRQIKQWGLSTAIAAPSIKEWDCTGYLAARVTIRFLKHVYQSGGSVQFVAMDEPLVSALGLNTKVCQLTIQQAAAATARYRLAVLQDHDIRKLGAQPAFVDVEPYPTLSVATVKRWTTSLINQGFKPSALHLDVNVHAIDRSYALQAQLPEDLIDLQAFFKSLNIPFGILFWSGYDPEPTDKSYYGHAMSWVQRVKAIIGKPDQVVLTSWVRRCSVRGPCTRKDPGCNITDPTYCGSLSVPTNLSERKAYTSTRLLLDSVSVFDR